MSSLNTNSEDRVRAIAHSLWLEEGMPEGRAEAHWFKALELVNAEAALATPPEAVARKTRKRAPAASPARKATPRKTSKG